MGVHLLDEERWLIMPFHPSRTLENLIHTGVAVMNVCEDVRIFAGCLTGRRSWPTVPAAKVQGHRLVDALTHVELSLENFDEDPVRPRCVTRTVHMEQHAPFLGFNRAQSAVLEAAILASRLDRLSAEKIRTEMAIHEIALEKTGGLREREAWDWVSDKIRAYLEG